MLSLYAAIGRYWFEFGIELGLGLGICVNYISFAFQLLNVPLDAFSCHSLCRVAI